jgi:hypothetical protein
VPTMSNPWRVPAPCTPSFYELNRSCQYFSKLISHDRWRVNAGQTARGVLTVEPAALTIDVMPSLSRGRPPKFGRPARVVALTLPEDALQWLQSIHRDLGWAIVSLIDRTRGTTSPNQDGPRAPAELVQLPGRRALIVVDPACFKGLPGVSTIPLVDGRAFLALANGQGIADLELAVADQLEASTLTAGQREVLQALKAQLRKWRKSRRLTFHSRSIIVVERVAGIDGPKALEALKGASRRRRPAARRAKIRSEQSGRR